MENVFESPNVNVDNEILLSGKVKIPLGCNADLVSLNWIIMKPGFDYFTNGKEILLSGEILSTISLNDRFEFNYERTK